MPGKDRTSIVGSDFFFGGHVKFPARCFDCCADAVRNDAIERRIPG